MIVENGDLGNQAADQRLVEFRDGGGLAFDEILQILDLLHLFILDDAVHLGLMTLITELENLICDGVVVVLLVDLLQKLLLQLVQSFVYDLWRESSPCKTTVAMFARSVCIKSSF